MAPSPRSSSIGGEQVLKRHSRVAANHVQHHGWISRSRFRDDDDSTTSPDSRTASERLATWDSNVPKDAAVWEALRLPFPAPISHVMVPLLPHLIGLPHLPAPL